MKPSLQSAFSMKVVWLELRRYIQHDCVLANLEPPFASAMSYKQVIKIFQRYQKHVEMHGNGKQSTETSVEIIITVPCTVLHYNPYINSCSRYFSRPARLAATYVGMVM